MNPLRLRRSALASVFAAGPLALAALLAPMTVWGTPANRLALGKYYGRYLSRGMDACTTCHLPLKPGKSATSLADFPHNVFGNRLRILGEARRKAGKKADIPTRLAMVAHEDADGDGIDNQTEILLSRAPGDPADKPDAKQLALAPKLRADFAKFLAGYHWLPFEMVKRPPIPKVKNASWVRNPIDAFIASEHEARGLKPRPAASKEVLLRRVYLDLIGLEPAPDEIRSFENDRSTNAYEKVVDRLLASPRYGERWGRHWMDVWRYSDWAGWTDGGQVRDSKPFIWRWKDWIIESLNTDKGYERMVQEMLAADELCPEDRNALRATGFLVRNYKMLSREQWMEDTLNHTSKAFMGVTMHCSKCHDHMYDPISQEEYYRLRAVFEPHNVRTDRLPGQPDTTKDGLVLAYDAEPKAATYLFVRGDERNPEKSKAIPAGVPAIFGGAFDAKPVKLPLDLYRTERREFEVRETLEASEKSVSDAMKSLTAIQADKNTPAEKRATAEKAVAAAEARHTALLAVLAVESLEDAGKKDSDAWKQGAIASTAAQRRAALVDAELALMNGKLSLAEASAAKPANDAKRAKGDPVAAANKLIADAEKALSAAQAAMAQPPSPGYKPRITTSYPTESTGRRLAFARWLTDRKNPLAARVAVNHIWARHFGQGLVPSLNDFGRNGRPPTHPQLLDWLAAEFMEGSNGVKEYWSNGGHHSITPTLQHSISSWSMKRLHRLIVTSATYRMASTPDVLNARIDPDNNYLWRMSSRRMEAEVVRDNVLYTAGDLDETMGGPDIDHNLGLTSKRRSVYLRLAAEKEPEFLKVFDGPSVTECYERKQTVMPQQALALANSELTQRESRNLAAKLDKLAGPDQARFIQEVFLRVLARRPTAKENQVCLDFLIDKARDFAGPKTVATSDTDASKIENRISRIAASALHARENLVLILFNHNDFVTVR